VKLILPLPGRE